MRVVTVAAVGALALLSACGNSKSSPAADQSANSVESNASAPQVPASGPVKGAEALNIMHQRHEGMETIGKTTKALKRELDGSPPDMASVSAGAAQIADLSRKASNWFPAGTGPDIGKTGAKPEIWQPQNKADFATKLSAFQRAAAAFNATTTGGDVAAMKARYADLGNTCKACHDKYRTDMHH